jgi:hypothetical protein
MCHNRVAHKEDYKLVLAGNQKHEDWMKMEACFRCHNLDASVKNATGLTAPGKCSVCHPADFQLKPENHSVKDFDKAGHPALYKIKGKAYCYMCHDQKTFCDKCHGTQMPHSDEYKAKTHGADAVKPGILKKCEMCHEQSKTQFCNKCHHGTQSNWDYKTNVSWIAQHPAAIAKAGSTDACLKCHKADFCAACHTANKIVPADHKKATWGAPPTPKVGHPAAYTKSPTSCAVCHGSGGSNAAFCKACHKTEIPHPSDFQTSHGPLVQKNNPPKAVCLNCHKQFFCDSCHHAGSSRKVPWMQVHPGVVKKTGPDNCFKCHKETFCSNCHVHLVNGKVPGR